MPVEMQTHISDILCQGLESLGNLAIDRSTGVGGHVSHILRSEGLQNHHVLLFKLGDMATGQLVVLFNSSTSG